MPRTKRTKLPDSPTALPEIPPDEVAETPTKEVRKPRSVVKTVALPDLRAPEPQRSEPRSVLPPEDKLLCTVCWTPTLEREMSLFTNDEGIVGHRCGDCKAKSEMKEMKTEAAAAAQVETPPEPLAETPVASAAREVDDRWEDEPVDEHDDIDTPDEPYDAADEAELQAALGGHGYEQAPMPPPVMPDVLPIPPPPPFKSANPAIDPNAPTLRETLSSDVAVLQKQVMSLTAKLTESEQLRNAYRGQNEALRETALRERNAADQATEAVRHVNASLAELEVLLGTSIALDGSPGAIASWMTAMAETAVSELPDDLTDEALVESTSELLAQAFAARGAHNDEILARLVAMPNGAGQACLKLEIAVRQLAKAFEVVPGLTDTDVEVRKDVITQAWIELNEAAGVCRASVLATIDDLTRQGAAAQMNDTTAILAGLAGLPPRKISLRRTPKPVTESES